MVYGDLMSVHSTMTGSVTPELTAFVAGRLAAGRYNTDNVVRAAPRLCEPDLRTASERPAGSVTGAR